MTDPKAIESKLSLYHLNVHIVHFLVELKNSGFYSSDSESDGQEEQKDAPIPAVTLQPEDEDSFDEPIVDLQKPIGGGNQINSSLPPPSN